MLVLFSTTEKMNVTTEEVINIIAQLAEHENMRITLKESLQGGLITGLCTTVGGLLGGRTGLLIGGAIGTALGMYAANDFKSVVYIIRNEMSNEDRALLANSMNNILLRTSAPYTLYKILSNEDLHSSAISLITQFVQKMGYQMVA